MKQLRTKAGGPIRAVIQIPAMPSYIERMLLDKLKKKLVDEYGEPEPPPKPDEPASDGEGRARASRSIRCRSSRRRRYRLPPGRLQSPRRRGGSGPWLSSQSSLRKTSAGSS